VSDSLTQMPCLIDVFGWPLTEAAERVDNAATRVQGLELEEVSHKRPSSRTVDVNATLNIPLENGVGSPQ